MKKAERKISKEDLLKKISKKNLRLVEENVFCHNFGSTTIIDYNDHITVNDLNGRGFRFRRETALSNNLCNCIAS